MPTKVYSSPVNAPAFPTPFSMEAYDANNQKYLKDVKAHLNSIGYKEPETGEVVRFPIADGYAEYMVASLKGGATLIHLEIGDAWNYPHIERLNKGDIVQKIKQQESLKRLFNKGG